MTKEIKEIKLEELQLDLENPRFGLSDAKGQPEAIAILALKADLKELWESIAQNKFQRFEPLVAFKVGKMYTVVEGNRRLAAAKTLINPGLLSDVKISAPPEISAEVRASMATLPTYIVGQRSDADDYIGFKHINGPSTWSSLAKAKFAVKLFEKYDLPAGNEDNRVETLSKSLGDSRQLILRSLVGYKVFEQSKALGFFDDKDLAENSIEFSHLYTMLQNPSTRTYIGLTPEPLNEKLVVDNPVPPSHHDKLKFLISWLFGDKDDEPLIKSQGTDRPKLTKILAHSSAVETLETTRDFEQAADEAGYALENWMDSTVKLSTLSKKISDGVSTLPPDLENETVQKATERLNVSARNIRAAESQISSLFLNV